MIVFKNTGALDLRAIKTFGLSSKDESQIGRFGTGLKYATSVIVRNGGGMKIFTEGEWHEIGVREEEFRGKVIEQVTLDGADLPFTTDLGRDWEVWMAFRELYSNSMDEGGTIDRRETLPEAGDGEVLIAVDLDAFEAIYFSMEEHFIGTDEEPVWSSDDMDVHPGRSSFIFYRGIAIQKLKEPAAYRYNLKGFVDLTEDRTAKYSWQVQTRITSAILRCDNSEIVRAACDQRNPYEAGLDYSDSIAAPGETFLGVSVDLAANCNPTASAVVRAQLPADTSEATILQKGAPGAEALQEALQVLRDIGADLSKAKFVLAEGVQIFGEFDVRGDAVFLSERIFDDVDKMTIACIEGYAGVAGKHWQARMLVKAVKADA